MARVRWRSAGYLAVFVVSALATYNSLQTLHGHARAGRHLEDEHVHHHHHQGVPAGSQISSRHHGARMDADVDPFHRTPRHREKGGSVAHIDASRDEVDAAVKGGEFGLGASSFGADAGAESSKADVIDTTPKELKATKKKAGGNGKYHVLLTANDAVYVRWQSRIMYHQYKKIAADPASVSYTHLTLPTILRV